MKIAELIKDLEAMQAEGMTEVKVMTMDDEGYPALLRIDHVSLYRNKRTVTLVAASANV